MPLARLIAVVAALYLYVFPYYPRLQSANELPRVYLVKAIVDDHTFAIDRGIQRFGPTSDLARYGDHYYQNKAPGASLLAVPAYAAVKAVAGEPSLAVTMWLCRVITGVIPTLVLLALLWRFLERLVPDEATRRLALVAYALGSMAMPYSLMFYAHQLSAVCIASAWILAQDFADRRRGLGALVAAGLLAGAGPLVDYEAAFALVPIAAHVVWKLRAWPRRELVRAIAIAIGAAAIPIALLLYYHAACFGSPFATGYTYATSYARDHDHGLLGMTHPTSTAFVGITISPGKGLFALAPWLLLAIPGGVALWRRGERAPEVGTDGESGRLESRALVLVCAGVAAAFLYFNSSIGFWHAGWSVGPRYMVAMLPFLVPLVAAGLAEWRARWPLAGLACGLVLVGVAIYTLACATLPTWPETLRDPLYEVTFRLLGDGAVAPSLGRALGLHGLVSIAPFVLGSFALAIWAIVRAMGTRALAVAVAVAAVAILAFAAAPRSGPDALAGYERTLHPAVAQ